MLAKTIMNQANIESMVSKELLDRSFNKSGLCAYCSRNVNCVASHDNGLVYNCDDYEAGEETQGVNMFSRLDIAYVDDNEPILYGLCIKCQNRDVCQLKTINGGVWHCIEYI
ncbi:MAG: hypothetical protein CVU48_04460 [Candidatus Cloacimonetes bacterium HGW-Cloacimonetes-1]|nr:MAG: hypothetical protein CVU48_04460 [Candidatus Cloacimonetes bacterium HGW-Cloacimonetes-1]